MVGESNVPEWVDECTGNHDKYTPSYIRFTSFTSTFDTDRLALSQSVDPFTSEEGAGRCWHPSRPSVRPSPVRRYSWSRFQGRGYIFYFNFPFLPHPPPTLPTSSRERTKGWWSFIGTPYYVGRRRVPPQGEDSSMSGGTVSKKKRRRVRFQPNQSPGTPQYPPPLVYSERNSLSVRSSLGETRTVTEGSPDRPHWLQWFPSPTPRVRVPPWTPDRTHTWTVHKNPRLTL